MRSRSWHATPLARGLVVLGAAFICSPAAMAASRLRCPDLALVYEHGGPHVPTNQMVDRLRTLVAASGWTKQEEAACYKELADDYRDGGSYRAETLYREAVALLPTNPWILEAIARYYRTYRGSKGLFAESEEYYVRAERAIEVALEDDRDQEGPSSYELRKLREAIIRGRIELNKQEGLGVFIPKEPEQKLGIYLGSEVDYARIPVPQKYLATDARRILDDREDFDTRSLMRRPARFEHRERLRIRYGSLPYLDVGWHYADVTDALAGDWPPDSMSDLDFREFALGAEDVMGVAPYGDVLWRLEYYRVRVAEKDYPGEEIEENDRVEKADRLIATTTFTRSFGRIKADLELFGSYAWVDRWWMSLPGNDIDDDEEHAVGASLRVLHFPDLATTERWLIDPRAQEFRLGFVRETQHFKVEEDEDKDGIMDKGMDKENVADTFYAGLQLTELIPRTDVLFLLNWFELDVPEEPSADSGNVELNLIITHRIIDWVNDLRLGQAEQLAGLARWTASLRLFDEQSTHALDDFENWGGTIASSVELFSGPLNRSTVILEAGYEVRDYYRLNDVQHLFHVALKIGF